MRILLKITLFMILFNVATFFIASTGFFSNAFYGDAVGELTLDDEAHLADPGNIIFTMASNSGETLGVSLGFLGEAGTFAALVLIILGLGGALTYFTQQSAFIAIPIAGILFFNLYANSKSLLNAISANFPSQVNYLILMFGICMLFMFIIYLIDIPSGQKSSD